MRWTTVVVGFLAGAWMLLEAMTPAHANPIMMGWSEGAQVPETFHVQISYLCSFPEEGGWPVGLDRDGEALDVEWVGPTHLTVNGGSGLDSYPTQQACDCDVPAGPHAYEIRMDGEQGGWPCAMTSLTVAVRNPPPGPTEEWVPPNPDDYEYPWDIPDQPFPRGLDCVEWCAAHSPPLTAPPRFVPTNTELVQPAGAGAGLLPVLAAFFLVLRRRG